MAAGITRKVVVSSLRGGQVIMCRSSKTKTKTKTKYLKVAAVITGKVVISWSGVHVQKFIGNYYSTVL